MALASALGAFLANILARSAAITEASLRSTREGAWSSSLKGMRDTEFGRLIRVARWASKASEAE